MKNTIVKFYDAEINGVEVDGEIYIALKPICEAIGLDAEQQRKTISDHPILSELPCKYTVVAADGKPREMLCLPLDFVPGWLFTVNANLVSEAARPTLLLFQRECYKVLRDYFFGNMRERVTRAERICQLYEVKTNIREQVKALKQAEKRVDKEIHALQQDQLAFPFYDEEFEQPESETA